MDKKLLGQLAASLIVTTVSSAAATAAANYAIKKMDQRQARKEAAANLCLNED